MLIVTDVLLYITTSLVFSIFCLCILFYYRTRDRFSLGILAVLLPLAMQMGLTCFTTYLVRSNGIDLFLKGQFEVFALAITLTSIMLTTGLLLTLSLYLLDLLPAPEKQKKTGQRIIYFLVFLFLILSLFFIILFSQGDWHKALDMTMKQYFSWGSLFYLVHGLVTLFYVKRSSDHEVTSLLKGISITFLPLIILFPLDLIFFRDYAFKLSYICFVIFSVDLYYFFSRYYFRMYEPLPESLNVPPDLGEKYDLSDREKEITALLVKGKTNMEIGETLFISVNTVKSHLKHIYKKMAVENRLQLIYLIHSLKD